MGAAYRRLGVPALEALNGAGVFYGGPASEAPAMAGKDAYIVGGANSAGQAALHLARLRAPGHARGARSVARRRDVALSGARIGGDAERGGPRWAPKWSAAEATGGSSTWSSAEGATGEHETVAADGLFVLIGARPRTDWLPEADSEGPAGVPAHGRRSPGRSTSGRSSARRLLLETSMPGVFAAGDVRHGSVKRVASAVGEGSIAIQLVHSLFEQLEAGGPPCRRRRR